MYQGIDGTEEFLRYIQTCLTQIYKLPKQTCDIMTETVRSILSVKREVDSADVLIDKIHAALDGKISKIGIAERLYDNDYTFTGDELRSAYNHYKNARVQHEATGIDYSVTPVSDCFWRTTIDVYSQGMMVDFCDVYMDHKPDTNDLGKFFDDVSKELDSDGDVHISSLMRLRGCIKEIDELEHIKILTKN